MSPLYLAGDARAFGDVAYLRQCDPGFRLPNLDPHRGSRVALRCRICLHRGLAKERNLLNLGPAFLDLPRRIPVTGTEWQRPQHDAVVHGRIADNGDLIHFAPGTRLDLKRDVDGI